MSPADRQVVAMFFPELLAKTNTEAREEVLNHRLLYDLKVAAARGGRHLLSYRPEVDHDGFDVILDDRDSLRKVQLKSVVNAGSADWGIHKGLLRPSFRTWERFGFGFTANWGTEGAVVLIDVTDVGADGNKPDRFVVTYHYTDVYYVTLVALGLTGHPAATVEAARRVRRELAEGGSTEKVSVPRGLFLAAKDPAAVLAVAGLHSPYRHGWQAAALAAFGSRFDPHFEPRPGETPADLDRRALDALREANGG